MISPRLHLVTSTPRPHCGFSAFFILLSFYCRDPTATHRDPTAVLIYPLCRDPTATHPHSAPCWVLLANYFILLFSATGLSSMLIILIVYTYLFMGPNLPILFTACSSNQFTWDLPSQRVQITPYHFKCNTHTGSIFPHTFYHSLWQSCKLVCSI